MPFTQFKSLNRAILFILVLGIVIVPATLLQTESASANPIVNIGECIDDPDHDGTDPVGGFVLTVTLTNTKPFNRAVSTRFEN